MARQKRVLRTTVPGSLFFSPSACVCACRTKHTRLGGQVPPLGLFTIIFSHTRLQSPLFPFSGPLSCAARIHSVSDTPPSSSSLLPLPSCVLSFCHFTAIFCFLLLLISLEEVSRVASSVNLLDLLLRQWLEASRG